MAKTIAEKIFAAHLRDQPTEDNAILDLDVVMCHEITTPIAIMDLVEKGMDEVFDPGKIKAVIDHVTPAKDSKPPPKGKSCGIGRNGIKLTTFSISARTESVTHCFRKKVLSAQDIRLSWEILIPARTELSAPFAAGVGTTDLEVGIYKGVCSFRSPQTIRIEITGALQPRVTAKDVILAILSKKFRLTGNR